MLSLNADGILNKLSDLRLRARTDQPDVISVCESKLDPDIQDSHIAIPNYSIFRVDRNRHGGGVVLFVNSELNAICIEKRKPKDPTMSTFGCVFV